MNSPDPRLFDECQVLIDYSNLMSNIMELGTCKYYKYLELKHRIIYFFIFILGCTDNKSLLRNVSIMSSFAPSDLLAVLLHPPLCPGRLA